MTDQDAASCAQLFDVTEDTNLIELGVQPGWFVQHGPTSIWFEIEHVFEEMVICAPRDPGKRKTIPMVGNRFTSIKRVASEPPEPSDWISLDRSKSFLDKAYPEAIT
jgi:hypothetical protein